MFGLVIVAAAAGCSTQADDGSTSSGTSSPSHTASAADGLDGVCSEILDNRDLAVFTAASDATTAVLVASVSGEEPSAAERDRWRSELTAGRDQLTTERDRLAEWGQDPAEVDELTATFDDRIALFTSRIDALEGDGPPGGGTLSPDTLAGPAGVIGERFPELAGRDCEMLLTYPGPDPDYREFQISAAQTCSGIVERRAATDFEANAATNLDVVAAVLDGGPVEPTEADLDAVRAVRDEWQHTHEDLQAVADSTVPDEDAWAMTLDYARERAEVFTERVDALESREESAITAAFDRSRWTYVGWEGWEESGLSYRDCRSITG